MLLKPLLDKTIVSFVTGCRHIITVDIYNCMPHWLMTSSLTAPCHPAELPPVMCWPLPCGGVARGSCHRVLSDAATLLSLYCIIVLLYCVVWIVQSSLRLGGVTRGTASRGLVAAASAVTWCPSRGHGHNTLDLHHLTENGDTGSADLGTFSSCSCSRQRHFASVTINATV